MRRSGVSAAFLCLLAVLSLATGCTKPPPSVTIQSGAVSLRSEAIQYLLDGKLVGSRTGPKVLTVRPGDVVNISVDRQTAQAGWVVLLAGQKISPILTGGEHHFAFTAPGFGGGPDAALAIFQQPPNGGQATGSWVFTLREDF
jgi:hypothetical protein